MKVLCFCRWIEKKIMVSTDDIVNQYTHYNRFIKDLKLFHRLNDEYFKVDTELRYDGDAISIEYTGINGNAKIGVNPKIRLRTNIVVAAELPYSA